MVTPGLTPLDEEREASMADEGGVSGALTESQGGRGAPLRYGLLGESPAESSPPEAASPDSLGIGGRGAALLAFGGIALGFAAWLGWRAVRRDRYLATAWIEETTITADTLRPAG